MCQVRGGMCELQVAAAIGSESGSESESGSGNDRESGRRCDRSSLVHRRAWIIGLRRAAWWCHFPSLLGKKSGGEQKEREIMYFLSSNDIEYHHLVHSRLLTLLTASDASNADADANASECLLLPPHHLFHTPLLVMVYLLVY